MHCRRDYLLLLLVSFGVGHTNSGFATICSLGAPTSYVIPTADGQHILVMLAPVPIASDDDKCELPSRETVILRDNFPVSGLYRIGSTVPIWAIDWYEREWLLKVSENGRFIVRINEFGVANPTQAGCGLLFYDAGIPIKTYRVSELVDYPSFIEPPPAGWPYRWVERGNERESDNAFFDFSTSARIDNGLLYLRTAAREEFTFELATGGILMEFRYWRTLFRACLAAALGIAGIVSWMVIRRLQRPRNPLPLSPRSTQAEGGRGVSSSWQFSLRRLMIGVILAPPVVAGCYLAPHIAILGASIAGTVFCLLVLIANCKTRGTTQSLQGIFVAPRCNRRPGDVLVNLCASFRAGMAVQHVHGLAIRHPNGTGKHGPLSLLFGLC